MVGIRLARLGLAFRSLLRVLGLGFFNGLEISFLFKGFRV